MAERGFDPSSNKHVLVLPSRRGPPCHGAQPPGPTLGWRPHIDWPAPLAGCAWTAEAVDPRGSQTHPACAGAINCQEPGVATGKKGQRSGCTQRRYRAVTTTKRQPPPQIRHHAYLKHHCVRDGQASHAEPDKVWTTSHHAQHAHVRHHAQGNVQGPQTGCTLGQCLRASCNSHRKMRLDTSS